MTYLSAASATERSAPGNPIRALSIDWIRDAHNKTIELGTLWTLVLGGGAVSSPQRLCFTAGLDMEQDGLFGTLTPN